MGPGHGQNHGHGHGKRQWEWVWNKHGIDLDTVTPVGTSKSMDTAVSRYCTDLDINTEWAWARTRTSSWPPPWTRSCACSVRKTNCGQIKARFPEFRHRYNISNVLVKNCRHYIIFTIPSGFFACTFFSSTVHEHADVCSQQHGHEQGH